MELTLGIAFALALLVGLSLGLLGGGGSILTVPILSYVVGMPPREAIASSLFIVGTTSSIGALRHARAGRVRWNTGLLFGLAGMIGALLGGLAGNSVPGGVLMILFAVMMIATATAMIRGRKADGEHDDTRTSLVRTLGAGVLVGFATGLIGAGGGFLIVPALHLFAGLPMVAAVGTSLLVIVMNSLAGFAGNALTVSLDWPFVLTFTAIAIAGVLIGAKLTGRLPERTLRRGFGIFVLVMGVLVLAQEIPELISTQSS